MAEPPSEQQGADEEVATMGYVKQIVRQKLRRAPEFEENFLTIYPMLDMLIILVVFLLMQFATSTVASTTETSDLRIPYSTSQARLQEALPITIARSEIAVDSQEALELRNGQVDPSQKQGGGTGFLITPLFKKLKDKADFAKARARRNPNLPFKGEVQIIADKRTPFRTLAEVIYTLGQAEYKNIHFTVNKKTLEE